jgi:hypothetical protein
MSHLNGAADGAFNDGALLLRNRDGTEVLLGFDSGDRVGETVGTSSGTITVVGVPVSTVGVSVNDGASVIDTVGASVVVRTVGVSVSSVPGVEVGSAVRPPNGVGSGEAAASGQMEGSGICVGV